MRAPQKLLFIDALKNEIAMEQARIHLLGLQKNLSGQARVEGWEIWTQLKQITRSLTIPPAAQRKLKSDDLFKLKADVTVLSRRTNIVLATNKHHERAANSGSSNDNYGSISAPHHPMLKDTNHLVSLCSDNSLSESRHHIQRASSIEKEWVHIPAIDNDVQLEDTRTHTEHTVMDPVVFTLPTYAIQDEDEDEDNVEREWEDVSEIEPLLSKNVDLEDPEAGPLLVSGSNEYFEGGHRSFWRRMKDSMRWYGRMLKKMIGKSMRLWFCGNRE